MPFKSLAQERYLFAKKPEVAAKFVEHTADKKKLPDHVAKPGSSPWLHMQTGEKKSW